MMKISIFGSVGATRYLLQISDFQKGLLAGDQEPIGLNRLKEYIRRRDMES